MTRDPETLVAALLWLRNQYDVGDPALRPRVLACIDKVLGDEPPTRKGRSDFYIDYLSEGGL